MRKCVGRVRSYSCKNCKISVGSWSLVRAKLSNSSMLLLLWQVRSNQWPLLWMWDGAVLITKKQGQGMFGFERRRSFTLETMSEGRHVTYLESPRKNLSIKKVDVIFFKLYFFIWISYILQGLIYPHLWANTLTNHCCVNIYFKTFNNFDPPLPAFSLDTS